MKDRNNKVGPQIKEKKQIDVKVYVLPVIAILIASLWSATQHFAHSFNYNDLLGTHFNHIYFPWQILVWSTEFYSDQPRAFIVSGSIGLVVSGVGLLTVIIHRIVSANSSKVNPYLHGSARWANKKDIEASALFSDTEDSVFVGGWEDEKGNLHYLRHSGAEHVLTYAPTRSGKGVGLVIPTLLSWVKSCVITDLKGELWALTSGWRKFHASNKVIKFEPASLNGSIKWNPLEEIRIATEYEVGDVQNLATLMVDPDGKGLNDHWQKTSQALLVGLILHVLYKAKNDGAIATPQSIDAALADPDRDISELWMEMTQYHHVDGKPHSVVAAAGRDMMDRPDEEAGSVLSTTKSYLSLYRDPIVAANTSACEFKIKDLMNHDNPVSLYIVTQPNDKARLKPLVRILINMIIRLLADEMSFEGGKPVASYKHRLLMMLDEFPSLGKLEILQESLAFVAGYGIKCYLICQDINQLKSRETGYGQDETITSNCHIQNAYPPNRIETAKHLSSLTGQTTIIKEAVTTSGKRISAMHSNVSKTQQETARALLTEDECLRMPAPKKDAKGMIKESGDMVIYVAGYPAIYGKQVLYFKDPTFDARSKVKAPIESDVIRKTIVNKPIEVAL
ncbi:type IV secretory system conjugative DNA transfer family protein [Pseudoalteromonas sp. SSM20]|uniref:type IV secretory system conjugative DNA transfer family protein n=1 Tax=Pseudoalteromonas sp. SSM20 TaxID=3139394 RepID=UPI003BAAFAE8